MKKLSWDFLVEYYNLDPSFRYTPAQKKTYYNWYDATHSLTTPEVFKAISAIDWTLLRKQKSWLQALPCFLKVLFKGDIAMRDGLLSLLDALQDAAVADGLATERKVFGRMK